MTDETKTPKRPKRWLAFLLNFIFAPAGYIYAGRPRAAIVLVATLLILGAGLWFWTLNFPPGVYTWLRESTGLQTWHIRWPLGLLLGLHASWSPRQRGAVKGLRAWALALGLLGVVFGAAAATKQLYQIYSIPSASMEPTLSPDDIMLVRGGDMICRTPRLVAGAVVTQRWRGAINVRRLIAGPGQTVEMKNGKLIVDRIPVQMQRVGSAKVHNGTAEIWRETLANGTSYFVSDLGSNSLDDLPETRVPSGHWFTLGDNRDNSLDSRTEGPSPTSQMCGRAVKVLYSKNKAAIGRTL